MSPRRLLTATAVLGALLALLLPAAAGAAPKLVHRFEADDETVFRIVAAKQVTKQRRAKFTVDALAPTPDSPYAEDPVIARAALEIAGARSPIAGSTIVCAAPGVTAVYGTVNRGARRVVATLAGGRSIRLKRRRPPRAWGFDGWIVGRVFEGRRPVKDVRVFDRAGRRISTAPFEDAPACPGR